MLKIDEKLKNLVPDCMVGVVEAEVKVKESSEELVNLLNEECELLKNNIKLEELASEETIDALDGAKIDIVGGDSKISVAEEEELNAIAERVHRISGSDRKETNAKVIETFYKGSFAKATQSVIVAKDDVLVDALTAANLSVVDNAPIVLGTNSLSASQKEAIAYNAGSAKKIYQMSRNVAREVTKAVAQALKLS